MFKIVVFCGLIICSLGAEFNRSPGSGVRIVEGSTGTIDSFPYQVSVQTYGGHSCGGSLIKANIVVTAAHCLRDMSIREIKIRAGSTYHNRGGDLVGVSSYKVHPGFDTKTKNNDIALIFLQTSLKLGGNIQTIELASEEEKTGTPGVISGWGTESFYDKKAVPEYLKYANVNLMHRDICMSDKYEYGSDRIFPTMICAAGDGDSCQGDSGGPLAVNGKLAGVISWGFGCHEVMFPGVYTNIPVFYDWIKNNI